MPTCFIISPIGESGSEIRRNADDLRDLIIRPVLEPFGFTVVRGDHRSEAGQIDIDVIRAVQESDLCVIDISLPNPNVYYEFGRRDETGKPLILLKAKGSGELPVDIATRRYIEYDLDDRRGLIDSMEQLRNFVKPVVENGFESSGTGASLSELAEVLKRIERKIDRMGTPSSAGTVTPNVEAMDDDVNPTDMFKLAMRQKNIPMAERAMETLSYRMDKQRWLDFVVEQVAALGSRKAGDIMIENALYFMDVTESFKDKLDYLGCLVSNLNRTDREIENLQLVEEVCESLIATCGDEPVEIHVGIYNQMNRLYHGIYGSTRDKQWLEKALGVLQKALKLREDLNYIHYNLGLCLKARDKNNDIQEALQHFLRCVELDHAIEKKDADHLESLCEVLHRLSDPRLYDYLDQLEMVNRVKAQLLRSRIKV